MAKKNFPERLQESVITWFEKTQKVRNLRHTLLAHYANGFYEGGEGLSRTTMPMNLIDRGVTIIAPFLVMNNPRSMIQARQGLNSPNANVFAITLELALAHLYDEIELADNTLRPVVIDALFLAGVTKTGIWRKWQSEIGGYLHDIGQPYCDRIDWNDYIGDIAARNREENELEGHKYRLPFEFVTTSGYFKNYDGLKPDLRLYGETDPEALAKPDANINDLSELHHSVELIDLWIPKEGIVVTIPPRGMGNKIMRTVEWKGPESGPFDVLAFKKFPNSTVPIPPVYTWLDINKIVNRMVTKMKEDVEREKTIGVYEKSNDEDAQVIKDAKNADLVGLRDPSTVQDITLGGFNDKSFPFLQYLEHQYAISYSNLYGIGGRGSQANTLGQEQMLQYNATRTLDDMVDQFHHFVKSVTRKLIHFLWNHPTKQIHAIKEFRGIQTPVTFSKATQEGDEFDYTYDIDPYSMSRMNPDMKYQKLIQLVGGVIVPLLPLAAQQGSQLRVDDLVERLGKYLGENTEDWWQNAVPQGMDAQGTPSGNFGQMNDFAGASEASREGNLNQYEASERAMQPSPPQK